MSKSKDNVQLNKNLEKNVMSMLDFNQAGNMCVLISITQLLQYTGTQFNITRNITPACI